MYDSRYGSDSIHLHRKRREQEERDQIKRKKEKAAQEKVGVENLSVSQPEDASELEADSIAKKVMSGQNAEIPNNPNNGTSIQTKSDGENSGFASELQSQLSGSKGGGQALDDATRSEMESKMGADFGEVKIHTGNTAHEMNESVNAKAFTHGQDIYFRNGNYNPSSNTGKELLAHELVHTQQQGEGKVQPMIQRDHNEDEFKIYVDYKEELFQRDLAKLKDEKEIKKLTKAHKKFVKQADKFSRKMTKKSGWGATDYGTKAEDKFGDYSETIKEKKEEVKGEIAGVVLGLNGNITIANELLSKALTMITTDTGKVQPLLESAKKELENAQSDRKNAASFLEGADEVRVLAEYDKIIADYIVLIQKIQDNYDGIVKDQEKYNKLMAELTLQKEELSKLGDAAAASDDVVALVEMQKTALPPLKLSVEAAISNATGATRSTTALDEKSTQSEIQNLKDRETPLKEEVSKIENSLSGYLSQSNLDSCPAKSTTKNDDGTFKIDFGNDIVIENITTIQIGGTTYYNVRRPLYYNTKDGWKTSGTRFDQKTDESRVGIQLIANIDALPNAPSSYTAPNCCDNTSQGSIDAVNTHKYANMYANCHGVCYAASSGRIDKAYKDQFGKGVTNLTPGVSNIDHHLSATGKKDPVAAAFYGYGAGAPFAYHGYGTLVDNAGVWGGKLQKGAALQRWNSTDMSNLYASGGHSQIFRNYVYNENGVIIGMEVSDNSGVIETLDREYYESSYTILGVNLSDIK